MSQRQNAFQSEFYNAKQHLKAFFWNMQSDIKFAFQSFDVNPVT